MIRKLQRAFLRGRIHWLRACRRVTTDPTQRHLIDIRIAQLNGDL